jgi:hypothetical protein
MEADMPNPYGMTEVDVGAGINAYRTGQQDRREQILWKQQQDATALAAKNRAGVQGAIQAYAKDPKAPGAQDSLFTNLLVIDPETAFKTSQAFSQMSKDQAAQAAEKLHTVSSAFANLLSIPAPNGDLSAREAARQQMLPTLMQMGIPQDQIMMIPLDDEHLQYGANQGRDTEAILKDRHPDLMIVPAGGEAIDKHNPAGGAVYSSPYVKGADGTTYLRPGTQPNTAPANGPPPQAIEMLRQHPELAPQFDQKYGQGASGHYMGGAGSASPHTFPQ